MKLSQLVNSLMFDYLDMSEEEINKACSVLPNKILRWLGAHHPDNKTRKIFYLKTNIKIGEDAVINQNFIVSDNYKPLLEIGHRVAISPNVTVICASSPNNSRISSIDFVKNNLIVEKKVAIGDDSWIGANAIILPGVSIGKGAVIGAGSVVSKTVEDYATCAGNPCKLLKRFV